MFLKIPQIHTQHEWNKNCEGISNSICKEAR